MKFEIRTIDEKLNNLTQLVEENNNNLKSKINETDISDNYQFDDIDLPINSLDMLDNLEIKLMNDKTYRAHLVFILLFILNCILIRYIINLSLNCR